MGLDAQRAGSQHASTLRSDDVMEARNLKSKQSLGAMRIDLQDSFRQSSLDPAMLSPFQRVLLTTDGTVGDILEAYLSETLKVVKLDHLETPAPQSIPYLGTDQNSTIVMRRVLLRGKVSHKNYVYAESVLVPDALDPQLRTDLERTDKAIGVLMLEARTETFREILNCRTETADDLCEFFGLTEQDVLVCRTYRIFAGGKPSMLITEKFPLYSFGNSA